MSTMTISSPSLTTYNYLQGSFSDTLRCPCSNSTIPYHTFITLSATFHQVCSSDLVSDSWILLLTLSKSVKWMPLDWLNQGVFQFRLISTLCELANTTVSDAIRSFALQHLVTSNLLTEMNVRAQLNASVNDLIQSAIIGYNRLVDAIRLFTQVDQPYTGISSFLYPSMNAKLIINSMTNQQLYQVCFHSKEEIFSFLVLSIVL